MSDDKDTRNNKGLMANTAQADNRTSKFQMKDLPTEVARGRYHEGWSDFYTFYHGQQQGQDYLCPDQVGEQGRGHRATITEDFQVMKDVVLPRKEKNVA